MRDEAIVCAMKAVDTADLFEYSVHSQNTAPPHNEQACLPPVRGLPTASTRACYHRARCRRLSDNTGARTYGTLRVPTSCALPRSARLIYVQRIAQEDSSSRGKLLELRYKLAMQRAHLRELCFQTSELASMSLEMWTVALASAPPLESLRFLVTDGVDADDWSLRVVSILQAAARLCPRLRSLALPHGWDPLDTHTTLPTRVVALTALLECLPRWKPFGGLRVLRLNMGIRLTLATLYVTALAHNCPLLETVRGTGNPYYDQWHIGVDTWERFCVSYTQLVAFDWRVVPFATAFF
jgi:hypothetical protein